MKVRIDTARTSRRLDRTRIERVREDAIRAALDDLAERRKRDGGEIAEGGPLDEPSRSPFQSNGG